MNLKINLSKILFGYGLAIFPLFLLIGPLISELFLISVIFFSTFFIIKEKKYNFYFNRFAFFFLLFYLSTIFSTILNFYNFDYTKGGILYFRIPLFALSLWFILDNYNLFNKKIILFYILFFIILFFDALVQYYTGKNLIGYELIKNRISSFFDSELILGGFITRILPIFLIYLVMNDTFNDGKINLYYSALISLGCVIVYLSGERTSFGLLILFFSSLFFFNKHFRKLIIIITIMSVILSIVIPSLNKNENLSPTNRMFEKTFAQVIGKGEERYEEKKKKLFNKFYIFSHDHHGHYVLALKIFKDHIFFGTGTKGFRYLCRNKIYILDDNDGCSTHPHNTYIQILVSNGLIGFLLITFAFVYILREMFLCKKEINSQNKFDKIEVSKLIALSAIFINLWPIVPSGNFFNNWISMIYSYPVGFYLYFKFKNEEQVS